MILKIMFIRTSIFILKNHYKEFNFCLKSIFNKKKKYFNGNIIRLKEVVLGITPLTLITFLLSITTILEDLGMVHRNAYSKSIV